MASKNGDLRFIPINQIRENPVALRRVNKTTPEYMGLVDSIKQKGILNPISVREVKDPETDKIFYAVTDGLHRYTAGTDAGLKELPCYIKNLQESEILEAQIIANVHVIETRPAEYADQLQRILAQNPLLTASELASKISKTSEWLSGILHINKIKDPKIISLVNDGKIGVTNAIALSKLPEEEQPNFVDRALTQSPSEFVQAANQRAKEIKDARRQGKKAAPEEFVALPVLRRVKELKDEKESLKAGQSLLQEYNVTDPLAAWQAALAWVLQVDPKSMEVRKQKDLDRKRLKEEEKEKAKKEKEEKARREAAQASVEVGS